MPKAPQETRRKAKTVQKLKIKVTKRPYDDREYTKEVTIVQTKEDQETISKNKMSGIWISIIVQFVIGLFIYIISKVI